MVILMRALLMLFIVLVLTVLLLSAVLLNFSGDVLVKPCRFYACQYEHIFFIQHN